MTLSEDAILHAEWTRLIENELVELARVALEVNRLNKYSVDLLFFGRGLSASLMISETTGVIDKKILYNLSLPTYVEPWWSHSHFDAAKTDIEFAKRKLIECVDGVAIAVSTDEEIIKRHYDREEK